MDVSGYYLPPKYVAPTVGPWQLDSCKYTPLPGQPSDEVMVVLEYHHDVTGGAWERHVPGFGVPAQKHWNGEKFVKRVSYSFYYASTRYDPVINLPNDLWTNVWEPGSGDTGTDHAHRLPLPPGQIAVLALCQQG